ncbi:hypothetical protein ACFW1A_00905 [Kitasatospora sp. NPDC058965]|uniref:hypothetical protein n=1 Tax=Kitasatospora sp. NPDC058965 TaxID=3346682 RepID=UPI0036867307
MNAALQHLAPHLRPAQPAPLVPVLPALRELLPGGGLRPGTVVSVTGGTAVLLALAAAATREGTWCAVVGFEGLGLLGAAELGVDTDRLVVIEAPGSHWPEVAMALADGVGIVLLRPTGGLSGQVAARLSAAARSKGCVLLVAGQWPGAQVQLSVVERDWIGLRQGRGRLRARRITVDCGGRGAAARARRVGLWLPDADGAVRAAGEPLRPVVDRGAGAGRAVLAVVGNG